MRGGPQKTRKKKFKKTHKKVTSDTVSPQATEESNDFAVFSQSTACSLTSTPKRSRVQTRQTQQAHQTSMLLRSPPADNLSSISTSHPEAKQAELEYTEVITQLKTSEVEPSCCHSQSQSKRKRGCASQPRQIRKRAKKKQTESCSKTNRLPSRSQHGRTRKMQTQRDNIIQPSTRPKPKFELLEQDDSLLSSDLSIQLSQHEEPLPILSLTEDDCEDEEEEDELPSYLMRMDKKPPLIREGVFAWCRFRSYPFWPALVKKVHSKQKKASIIFIDDQVIHKTKGFNVALKTLKPFDCEEAEELVRIAKQQYDAAIQWSLDLIDDYRIKIACGSFSGSFIEYFAHDMSYPVRRMYPQAVSERLTIASDTTMEELSDDHKDDSIGEEQGVVSMSSKRLLPDRTRAAHIRADEKLVHFIVKQRMVEGRLLAVIRGQQQSRWLRSFLSANRKQVVDTYLEDDQLDQVYMYLNELYTTAVTPATCPPEVKSMECIPFVLDVLLPEAIIYAIAGVDKVSIKKAEEKYLRGRCMSNRERQAFDLKIEQEKRKKPQPQNTACALFSDPTI